MKIKNLDNQEYERIINKINNVQSFEKEDLLNNLVFDFKDTLLSQKAYKFRGAFLINKGEIKKGIHDFIKSIKHVSTMRLKDGNLVKNAIFENTDIEVKLKNTSLEVIIKSECLEYMNEIDSNLQNAKEAFKEMHKD